MKQLAKDIWRSFLVGFVLPGLILNYGQRVRLYLPRETVTAVQEKSSLPVKLRQDDGVTEREMDDYLVEVVLAEMPVSFEVEALKAQSIVARTYAWKAYSTGGKHGDGSVCVEASCCQGCCFVEDFLAQGGTQADVEKVSSAVAQTRGQVLTYDGELIEATYFSCSGGRTEDAVAVWGTDYPYLRSVDSPGEENAAGYQDELVLRTAELEEALDVTLGKVPVTAVTYTRGGGVESITLGGRTFTGTRLRELLDLRSTAFTLAVRGTEVVITTRGYGHRVGMSQYGAEAMALEGHTCGEILAHYYPGTELTELPDDNKAPLE